MPNPDKNIRTAKVPVLSNGVSQQPPTSRLPNQVASATNANFSVFDGLTRRPGTWIQQHVADGILPAGNNRLYAIVRDQNERYAVAHNRTASGAVIRVLELSTNRWATVDITAEAQGYLDAASPDEFRFRTIVDWTLILNSDMALGYLPGPDYAVAGLFRDYSEMVSNTPADGSYHQTTEDGIEPEGFWLYDVSGTTFATIQFALQTNTAFSTPTGIWNDTLGAPRGFLIYFRFFDTGAVVAAAWTQATLRLVKAGEFTGYTFAAGHYINITGGTGVTAGKRLIAAKISDDEIELAAATGFTVNNADTTFNGIATRHDVSFGVIGATDMIGIAASIQQTIRDTSAAALTALCSWTETDTDEGYFTITAPYRGTNATIISIEAGSATTDLSAVGQPFAAGTATITAGTGSGSLTLDVDARWTRVVAPGQIDALIDPETMPVKMVRENIGDEGTITANTVANPTVVTSASHGLVSGQAITITGSDSNVTIDGTHIVTVLTANTFTVPVNVATTPGTTGTWTSYAYFTIDVVDWNSRLSGTPISNPILAPWRDGLKMSDIRYWRGRMWVYAGEWAVGSQAGDLFNYWIEDVNALADSDPIAVQLSSDAVTEIDYAVPIRDSTILFTKAGIQFEFSSGDALTPISVKAKPITRYQSLEAEPKVLDPNIYFGVEVSCHVRLLEYQYDEVSLPSTAEDVSSHTPELIPLDDIAVPGEIGDFEADEGVLRKIEISSENGVVFLLRHDRVVDGEVFSRFVYVYRSHYFDTRKVQSAWTRWEFTGIRGIHDIAVIGDSLYLLVHNGTDNPPDFYIARVSIPAECTETAATEDLATVETTTA